MTHEQALKKKTLDWKMRKTITFFIVAVICCQCSNASSDQKEQATAIPAKLGLDSGDRFRISAGDRCPVCAMKIEDSSKFTSAIVLEDGETYYFCGTGCMIKSWLNSKHYLGVE